MRQEYLLPKGHTNLSQLQCCKPLEYFSTRSIDSVCVKQFKMHLKISVCFYFLAGTLAIQIDTGENPDLQADLKTFMSTVIEEICPDCKTGYLVVPTEPAWEAQALITHLSESLPTFAMMMYTLDRSGFKDPSFIQFGFYLVNSEVDLGTALKDVGAVSFEARFVVWVNFDFGRDLGVYLGHTVPRHVQNVIFIARVKGHIQVFRSLIPTCGTSSAKTLRRLRVCDTKALKQRSLLPSKVVEGQESVLTVAIHPAMLPYIERRTDNPGGYIGKLMNVLEARLNFAPKYDWNVTLEEVRNFTQASSPHIGLNLVAAPRRASVISSQIMMSEGVWMIVTPNSISARNVLALPFKNGIFLHVILLAIYTSAMLYFSQDLDKSRIMLRLFGMFFGVGVGWLPKKALYRFMVVLWSFTSYVLVQAYLASLTSELTSPITKTLFRNTQDLMESGIDIYCTRDVKKLYCSLESDKSAYICEKCRIIDLGVLERINPEQLSMNKSWRPFAVALDVVVVKSNYANMSVVTMMQERIGMWPAGVYAQKDMKLLPKIISTTNRLFEAGFLQHWLIQYDIKNTDNEESAGQRILTLPHLNDVFIILYVGWSCSIVVFAIEILTKWYHDK